MNPKEIFNKAMRAIQSAKILFESEDFDGACNRAYYAMFDSARAILLSINFTATETIKTHSGLISAFSLHFIKTNIVSAELGKALNKIEELRLITDYSGDPVSQEKSKWALDQAQIFVHTIHQLYKKSNSGK